MAIPKSLLKAGSAASVSLLLYIFAIHKVYRQAEEKMDLEKRLTASAQALKNGQKMSLNRENLEKQFLKAQALGLLQKGDRQKLVGALEKLGLENNLRHLSYQAEATEKKVFSHFPCRLTRITLYLEHSQDRDIFRFIRELSHKMPGVVVPEQFSLARDKTLGVSGTYHFYLLTLENIPK